MTDRRLGNGGLTMAPVGGCTGLSHASGAPTEKREAIKILRLYLFRMNCDILLVFTDGL